MFPILLRTILSAEYGGFHGWVTESYSGENVGHRPGERAAVLPRATIDITEIAIRFQNEITLAATITPRPRAMRDDRRPPTLRNCTELSTAPRVSARAFPVDANLRDLARLHAGHGAILRFNQSLGYGIPQLAHRRQLLDKHDRSSGGDATDRNAGDRNPYGAGIVQDLSLIHI